MYVFPLKVDGCNLDQILKIKMGGRVAVFISCLLFSLSIRPASKFLLHFPISPVFFSFSFSFPILLILLLFIFLISLQKEDMLPYPYGSNWMLGWIVSNCRFFGMIFNFSVSLAKDVKLLLAWWYFPIFILCSQNIYKTSPGICSLLAKR